MQKGQISIEFDEIDIFWIYVTDNWTSNDVNRIAYISLMYRVALNKIKIQRTTNMLNLCYDRQLCENAIYTIK